MKVSVIGTGYVGLVTGACLASKGHQVMCVDTDVAKVEAINARRAPIYEPGLDALLAELPDGQLRATLDLEAAVLASDLSLIAVGTPFDGELIDLSYVEGAARQIGRALRHKSSFHAVIVKSTVVPGTTDEVVAAALAQESGKRTPRDFGVGMNPEFLRQGEALQDFLFPDRIVIGASDPATAEMVTRLYAAFDDCPTLVTSTKTAEMIKYAANSLLATLISFSNEIGNLCQALGGLDATEVMRGVHLDRRLTPQLANGERVTPGVVSYLQAGCGFGGSCFPKDVKALVAHGVRAGSAMPVLEAVLATNERQPMRVVAMLRKHFPDLAGLRVAILGLAFKPGTDDMRESPAIPIVQALHDAGAVLTGFDPVAASNAARLFGSRIALCNTVSDAIDHADAILVLTSWNHFASLPALVAARPKPPLVVDGRRQFARTAFARYEGIGVDSEPVLSAMVTS